MKIMTGSYFKTPRHSERNEASPGILRLCLRMTGFEITSKTIVLFAILLTSCGDDNIAADQSEKTPEQEAQQKMNDGDYDGAVEILEPLVEKEPQEYSRFPLLAAAYAGQAGVDIFSLVESQIGGAESGSENLFSQLDNFLPDSYTQTEVNVVDQAVQTLLAIPEELVGVDGDPDFGTSAEFQLVLYQTIYSTMLLNLFVVVDINGEIDITRLEEISDAEVALILQALQNASNSANGEQSEAVGEAVDETLTGIEESEGSTDREKLINYVEAS